jgi:hypothetical protein
MITFESGDERSRSVIDLSDRGQFTILRSVVMGNDQAWTWQIRAEEMCACVERLVEEAKENEVRREVEGGELSVGGRSVKEQRKLKELAKKQQAANIKRAGAAGYVSGKEVGEALIVEWERYKEEMGRSVEEGMAEVKEERVKNDDMLREIEEAVKIPRP